MGRRSKRRNRGPQHGAPAPRGSPPGPGNSATAPRGRTRAAAEPFSHALPLAVLALACLAVVGALYGVHHYSLSAHQAAQQWPAVPCTIVTNDFPAAARSGRHKFRFEYEYEFAGQLHRSRELDLIPGEIGDEAYYLRGLARAHPLGAEATCYVNPADPTQAVFDREHMEALGLLHLLALPFLVPGLILGVVAVRGLLFPASAPPTADPLLQRHRPASRHIQAHCVMWGVLGVSLFLFWIMDGPNHFAWLVAPAGSETDGVVTWTGMTDGRSFLGDQKEFDYVYEIAGQEHFGRSYAWWTRYPLDAQVKVQYDPQAPERSYLAGTSPSWSPGLMVWPLLAFLVLMAVLYVRIVWLAVGDLLGGSPAERPSAQPG